MPAKRTLYWRKPRGNQIWKGVRDGNMKYVAQVKSDKETEYLFDLGSDESEQINLVTSRPDQAKRLRGLYDRWEHETRKDRRGQPQRR